MKNRPLALALAGLGVVATTLVVSQPAAVAAPDGAKDKKKNAGPDLSETGCRDITFGKATYVRDRTVDLDALPDNSYPDELQGDAGDLTLSLTLGQATDPAGVPSCPDVTYTMTVYGADGSQLESATKSLAGDGVTGTRDDTFTLATRVTGYAQDCLTAIATARVGDIVVDMAPNELPETFGQTCDGLDDGGLTYK